MGVHPQYSSQVLELSDMKIEVVSGGLGDGGDESLAGLFEATGETEKNTADIANSSLATSVAVGATAGVTMALLDAVLAFLPLGETLNAAFGNVFNLLKSIFMILGLLLRPLVDLYLPAMMALIFMLTPFIKIMNAFTKPLFALMMKAYGKFIEKWGPLLEKYMPMLSDIAGKLGEFAANLISWGAEFGEKVFEGDLGGAANMLFKAGADFVDFVIKAVSNAIPLIKSAMAGMWDNIKDIKVGGTSIETWVNGITEPLTKIWDFVTGLFEGEDNPVINFFSNAKDEAVSLLQNMTVAVIGILAGLFGYIATDFSPVLLKAFKQMGIMMKERMTSAIWEMAYEITKGVKEVVRSVTKAIIGIANAYNAVASITGAPRISTAGIKIASRDIRKDLGESMQQYNRRATSARAASNVAMKTTVNVMGDVSGEDLVKKIKTQIERYQGSILGQKGAMQGLS